MERKWMGEDGKKFLEKTMEHFFSSKKIHTSTFHFDFMAAIFDYFAEREVGVPAKRVSDGLYGSTPGGRDFRYNTLPGIIHFSRTDAEADALIMVLLEEILKTISQPIYDTMERRWLMSPDIDMRGGID